MDPGTIIDATNATSSVARSSSLHSYGTDPVRQVEFVSNVDANALPYALIAF
jgi:hypothetical protein